MNVTGSHGQELFIVPPHHSRVYLPESLVLHDNEYNVMKKTTEQRDTIEAKKLPADRSIDDVVKNKDLVRK